MHRRSRHAGLGFALAVALALGRAVAARGGGGPGAAPGDLDELARWMTGSFSSAAQAARDSAFYDIRLHIVPVWTARTDARWFYVEQATAGHVERPYRQRVYRLSARSDSTFESAVFTLPAPLRFAGAFRDSTPLAALTPDSLTLRAGCAVVLWKAAAGAYAGGTAGRDCASDLRGAVAATSEVTITAQRMVTLDRGFDAAGNQVWGSTAGGYEFDRVP